MPAMSILGAWIGTWSLVGVLVGATIAFSLDGVDLEPVLRLSVPFAIAVGLTALLSARVVFPSLLRFPLVIRLGLQILTLISGAVFGSLAVFAISPLFALARPAAMVWIVAVNALIAVVTGLGLYTYESLRRQVEASYAALRRREALDRELAIAREVQRELLPRTMPRARGLDIAGVSLPAIGVGGDLFDFLPAGGDRIGIVIADVAGKGLPAALLMAGLQTGIRSVAEPDRTPAHVLRRLNTLMYGTTPAARYATVVFAWWDGGRRLLTYSNAGHFAPMRLSRERRDHLDIGGRPIGMFNDSTYEDAEITLEPGDNLVLFTDGILEAPAPGSGEEYGEDRLAAAVLERNDLPIGEAVDGILAEVRAWIGDRPPHDDVTLVLLRAR
jgi:hypothetical protein